MGYDFGSGLCLGVGFGMLGYVYGLGHGLGYLAFCPLAVFPEFAMTI